MADKKRNPDQILLRTKREALLALIPSHLRGIELRMIIIGQLFLEDGTAVAAIGADRDGKHLLLEVELQSDATAPVSGSEIATRLRARGLYVDPEQRLSVFFDRRAIIVPRESVSLLARHKRLSKPGSRN